MITLEQKNKYMRHQIAVLESIMKNNKPSEVSTKIDTASEYFEDSCRHSNLYHLLWEYVDTMKTMVKYNEVIIASENKES